MALKITCTTKPFDLTVLEKSIFGQYPGFTEYHPRIRLCTEAEEWRALSCTNKLEYDVLIRQCIHIAADGQECLNVVLYDRITPLKPSCNSGVANDLENLRNLQFVRTTDGEVAIGMFVVV